MDIWASIWHISRIMNKCDQEGMLMDAGFEDLFKAACAHVPGGVCHADSWLLMFSNKALCDLLGSQEQPVENDALSHWLARGVCNVLSDGKGENGGKILFRHPDGTNYLLFWWSVEARKRVFLIQQIPLEELSWEAKHSFREVDKILEFIHDGIWVIDGNGITRRINRAMERIAGIRAEEVVGRHVSEPLREGRFKTCVTLRALETKHTVTLFDDYSNGKRCLNTSTPVFDKDGNVWRVIAAIRDITELENLEQKLSDLEVEALAYRLRARGLEEQSMGGLLGQSPALQRVLADISKASQTDVVTLILGETGTGKSLAAKIIHDKSARSEKPFVTVNCGAIPSSLMESEIFGYENGAFTGAQKGGKPGMLELAGGGTLFLDEIGELAPAMQVKLLHILDRQPIYRVGGTRPIRVDCRIIAATNRPLDQMVKEGNFREDLFYRLRVLCVDMPPLRNRKDDILLLAWNFLGKIGEATGHPKRLDKNVEKLFLTYGWPGNVRELQSVIQSLATLCERDKITQNDLPGYMRPGMSKMEEEEDHVPTKLSVAIENLERKMLANALDNEGSTYKAAKILGISQSQVVRKAKKYGLRFWREGEHSRWQNSSGENKI